MQSKATNKRQRTQQAIISAGLKLLKQAGTAFTMDELAQVAGVSRRTLFNHFNGKTALLLSIGETSETRYRLAIDQHLSGISASDGDTALSSTKSPDQALRSLFDSIDRQWREQGTSAAVLLDALSQARSSEAQTEAMTRYAETFAPHLRRWREHQLIRPDIDIDAAAYLLSTTLSSALFMLRSGCDTAAYRQYVNLASSAILPRTKAD